MNLETPIVATAVQIKASRALFDKHPEDVIGALSESGRALEQLEALFIAIEDMAASEANAAQPNNVQIARIALLAGAGRHVAADMANIADFESAGMRAHLRKGVNP